MKKRTKRDRQIKRYQRIMEQRLLQLEKNISAFSSGSVIKAVAEYAWEILDKEEKTEEERKIISCISWICLIAIGAKREDTNIVSTRNPTRENFLDWSSKLHQYFINLTKFEYAKDMIGRLLEVNDDAKEGKWISNSKETFKNCSKDKQVNVSITLLQASIDKIIKHDVAFNYAANPTLPIVRSWLFIKKLQAQTNSCDINKLLSETMEIPISVDGLHNLLYQISVILLEKQGIINPNTLMKDIKASKLMSVQYEHEEDEKQEHKNLLKLLNKLSISKEEAQVNYSKMREKLANKETLLVNENPFCTQPLYKQEHEGKILFICPAWYLFSLYLEQLFPRRIDDWRKKLAEESKKVGDRVGKAREECVYDFLRHYSAKENSRIIKLVKVDEEKQALEILKKPSHNDSRADFIIETKEHLFIIEVKNSLGLWRPFYEDPKELFKTWDRIRKALDQCKQTKDNLEKEWTRKKVFFLVIVNETVLTETIAFARLLYEAPNVMSELDLQFGRFSIISLAAFECLVYSGHLDTFARDCKNAAEKNLPLKERDDGNYTADLRKILNLGYYYGQDTFDLSFFDEAQKEFLTQTALNNPRDR